MNSGSGGGVLRTYAERPLSWTGWFPQVIEKIRFQTVLGKWVFYHVLLAVSIDKKLFVLARERLAACRESHQDTYLRRYSLGPLKKA